MTMAATSKSSRTIASWAMRPRSNGIKPGDHSSKCSPAAPSLGDVRYRNVGLNDDIQQVQVPNDFQTQVRESGAEREKVDDGFHAKLPFSDYGATSKLRM